MTFLEIFFLLLIGHAITDYALQPPNIAQGKNRHIGPPPGYNPEAHGPIRPVWPLVMTAHALVSAAPVYIFIGPELAVFEALTHWLIDFFKCERLYNLWVDQALHVGLKAIYAYLAVTGGLI